MKFLSKLSLEYLTQVHSLSLELNLAQWTLEHYAQEIEREDSRHIIAINETENLIGFILGRFYPFGEGEILNIGVSRNHQRMGVASRLLNEFLDFDSVPVWLEVRESNNVAINFYKRHGFLVVGSRPNYYIQPKENALIMKLERF